VDYWASVFLCSEIFLSLGDSFSVLLTCRAVCKLFQSLVESNPLLCLCPQTSRLAFLIAELGGWRQILGQRERTERIERNLAAQCFQASTFYPFGELESESVPKKPELVSHTRDSRKLPPFHHHLGLDAEPFKQFNNNERDSGDTGDGVGEDDRICFASILCSNLLVVATRLMFRVYHMAEEETMTGGSERRSQTVFRPIASLAGSLDPHHTTRFEVIQQTHAVILSCVDSPNLACASISLWIIDGVAQDKTELKFNKKYTAISFFGCFGSYFLLVFRKMSLFAVQENSFQDADDELEELMRLSEVSGLDGDDGLERSSPCEENCLDGDSSVLELYALNAVNGSFSRHLKLRDLTKTLGEVILFASGFIVSVSESQSLLFFSLHSLAVVASVALPFPASGLRSLD
jgi:hypothetical protein